MRLPDFLIIGAAKSGTSTLYKYLKNYSSLYLPNKKEPAFFARDERYSRGLEWYSEFFKEAQVNQICGEASTDYSKCTEYPETAKRIFQALPNVKMIYIMRNPVDRAYAHYRHIILTKERRVENTFEKEIKNNSFCLDASNYLMQIEKYTEFFPRESFLFFLMEPLIKEPSALLNQIFSFLNLEELATIEKQEEIIANSANQRYEYVIRSNVMEPINNLPGIEFAKNILSQKMRDNIYNGLKKSWYGKKVIHDTIVPPMSPETRQLLIENFKEHNQKLSQFLNIDLSCWNK